MDEQVTISKTVYDGLEEDSQFLHALIAAGVDNWDGYDVAQDIVNGWKEEDLD